MSDEHTETGTGWPQPAGPARPGGPAGEPDPRPDAPDPDELSPLSPTERPAAGDEPGRPTDRADRPCADPADGGSDAAAGGGSSVPAGGPWRRLSPAGVMIGVLLVLLGFTLAVQLKTTSTDPSMSTARQEDLVRILYDLDAREMRLRQDIAALEESQRQLRSGEQGRQAALEEATRRADELGILAGTLPARGPGLAVRFETGSKPISARFGCWTRCRSCGVPARRRCRSPAVIGRRCGSWRRRTSWTGRMGRVGRGRASVDRAVHDHGDR